MNNALTKKQSATIESVISFVTANGIMPGDRLPSIREFSEITGASHVTVAETYRKLAENGYVDSNGKSGTSIKRKFSDELVKGKNKTYAVVIYDSVYDSIGIDSGSGYKRMARVIRDIRRTRRDIEFISVSFDSSVDGLKELKELVSYHYWSRAKRDNIVFVLSRCALWIKHFFADGNIPALVIGGMEEDLAISSVGHDEDTMLNNLITNIDKADAWPLVFIIRSKLIGNHKYIKDHLQSFDIADRPVSVRGNCIVVSSDAEVAREEIVHLLTSTPRPGTLLIQEEKDALGIISVCDEIGLSIPDDLKLISMDSGVIGRFIKPTITGISSNLTFLADSITELLDDICYNNVVDRKILLPSMLLYRESFPRPANNKKKK